MIEIIFKKQKNRIGRIIASNLLGCGYFDAENTILLSIRFTQSDDFRRESC